MDLGQCPRCAKPWVAGKERCGSCGFVPIGAGLSNIPKKKKKRIRPYREGTSLAPILLAFFTAMVGYYGFTRRPWENGFEEFRVSVLGEAPPLRMKGDWEVTKLVTVDPKTKMPLAPTSMTQGRMSFTDKGKVEVNLMTDDQPWSATGRYVQEGNTMVMNGFKTDPPSQMPGSIRCTLADLGEGSVIATMDGKSALYLQKIGGREALKKTLTYRMLNGALKGKGGGE